MDSKLVQKTLFLIRNRSVKTTYARIEESTGVPVGWLKRFTGGHIQEPSCNRVEALYEFLSGESLL